MTSVEKYPLLLGACGSANIARATAENVDLQGHGSGARDGGEPWAPKYLRFRSLGNWWARRSPVKGAPYSGNAVTGEHADLWRMATTS